MPALSWQTSISAYYWTPARFVFVATLSAIGAFLVAYRGYDTFDRLLGTTAGCCSFVTAALPTTAPGAAPTVWSRAHFVSAAGVFICLALFSILQFTQGDTNPSPGKSRRNVTYRLCGWLIILFMVLVAAYKFGESVGLWPTWLETAGPVFFLESFMLWAFGVAWVVKGRVEFGNFFSEEPDAPPLGAVAERFGKSLNPSREVRERRAAALPKVEGRADAVHQNPAESE